MPLLLAELGTRKQVCQSNKCGEWAGSCKLGHKMTSDAACPKNLFSASVMASRGPTQAKPQELTWAGVLAEFSRSMVRWIASGVSLVSPSEHALRYATCQKNQCGMLKGFACQRCGCIVYIKSKMQSESCPLGLWR